MCKVLLDLSDDKNFNFAIYNLVLQKNQPFTIDDITNELLGKVNMDHKEIRNKVCSLFKIWVKTGFLHQDLDDYVVLQ